MTTATMTQRQQPRIAADQKAYQQAQARQLFDEASTQTIWEQLLSRLRGERRHLLDLNQVVADQVVQAGATETTTVSLSDIQGSNSRGRTEDFDSRFRPRHKGLASRWTGLAAARRLGRHIPPVRLVRLSGHPNLDGALFVEDGHHRISVAYALGDETIAAVVTTWELTPAHRPVTTLQPQTAAA